MLLPPGFEFIDHECRILIPGFATYTPIRTPRKETLRLVNTYLWPGAQQHIWESLLAALPTSASTDPSLLIAGDFNIDLAMETARAGTLLHQITSEWGLLRPPSPTWKGRTGMLPKTLDGGVVPMRALHSWQTTAHWSSLSDHAIITFRRGSGTQQRSVACTPARFWMLPDTARAELRRTWGIIAKALAVPECQESLLEPRQQRPQVPGESHRDDPFHEMSDQDTDNADGMGSASSPPETGAADGTTNPLLFRWGLAFTQATFKCWWRRWRRGHSLGPPEKSELARISSLKEPGPHQPSPALGNWLRSMDGPCALSPSSAQHWLGVWTTLENAARSSERLSLGATVNRTPPAREVTTGRAVHKPRLQNHGLRRASGEVLTDKVEIGQALVDSRGSAWFTKTDWLPNLSRLLDAYRGNKEPLFPALPNVTMKKLRACILAAYGSAPGVDGMPYEIFHLHPQFFAALLFQAFAVLPHEERRDPWGAHVSQLDKVLGPAWDLLVWIPKALESDEVGQQRPLQLPTCLRRLFGGACAQLLGPIVEAELDPAQAAIVGGSCYQNIAAAYRHLALEEKLERPPLLVPHVAWICQKLFGSAYAAVMQVCTERQRKAHPSIRRTPASFLLDQAKAFELMSHEWLVAVLNAWKVPRWVASAFLVSVEGRKLRDKLRPAWLSDVLRRGAGMGGPLSPLTWNLSSDPIIINLLPALRRWGTWMIY